MSLIRVTGREHLPAHGPAILASNHLSFIDSARRTVTDEVMWAITELSGQECADRFAA